MATNTEQIVAIDAAIYAIMAGGGAQSITNADGRTITYTDVSKLIELKASYQRLASQASGTRFTRGIPK